MGMTLLLGTLINLLIVIVWGAVFSPPISVLNASHLRYHPGMETMWMTDDVGKLVKVRLTKSYNIRNFASLEDNVSFFLYSREVNGPYELAIGDNILLTHSSYNCSRPTIVITHGFWNNYQSDVVQILRQAYLMHYDVNVVGVDWGNLARGPWYVEAVAHTEGVGQQVARLIDFLVTSGAKVGDFHLIGHSLGAHVSAFASNYITSGRITRITGLDPALPLFWFRPPEGRLDPTDADYTDCIHTCGGYLGFYDPLCSHDFYPNGGRASQPGCTWDLTCTCSHGRSYHFFSASLSSNFTARSCSNAYELEHRSCTGSTGLMGGATVAAKPGIYYLETGANYPYLET